MANIIWELCVLNEHKYAFYTLIFKFNDIGIAIYIICFVNKLYIVYTYHICTKYSIYPICYSKKGIYDMLLYSTQIEISENTAPNSYMFMQHDKMLHSLIVTQSAVSPC